MNLIILAAASAPLFAGLPTSSSVVTLDPQMSTAMCRAPKGLAFEHCYCGADSISHCDLPKNAPFCHVKGISCEATKEVKKP